MANYLLVNQYKFQNIIIQIFIKNKIKSIIFVFVFGSRKTNFVIKFFKIYKPILIEWVFLCKLILLRYYISFIRIFGKLKPINYVRSI